MNSPIASFSWDITDLASPQSRQALESMPASEYDQNQPREQSKDSRKQQKINRVSHRWWRWMCRTPANKKKISSFLVQFPSFVSVEIIIFSVEIIILSRNSSF